MKRLSFVLLGASIFLTAQPPPQKKQAQPKQRDLKYEGAGDSAPDVKPVVLKEVAIPRSYALVVGVGAYKNLSKDQQLDYAERDAESIYSILISPEGGNFRAENVRKLIGAKATLANVRRELEEWLPSVSKEDDRVIVYFAGHGFVHGGKGYLAPHDLNPADIPGTGYPMATLGSVIGTRVKAKWKVLLTDSCHSGAITPDADVESLNKGLQSLDRSLFSLTASRARERSFESEKWGGGHGIFTYYVVKGLEGAADESHDGIVTADELAEYVRVNVRQATGGQQNPTSEKADFDPNMLLSYIPSNAAPAAPSAAKFGTLIFTSNMDGAEIFIDGKSAGTVEKGGQLRLPGLPPGPHSIKGVRMGYEPDGPREEMVYPGRESTVTVKFLIQRRRNKAALDEFDKGMKIFERAKGKDDYQKAASFFTAALAADPTYSQAAMFLGRAYRDMFEEEQAQKYFKKAIEIDPDYVEARVTYGGMLLDKGDSDEAIRQLNAATQRDKQNALGFHLLGEAMLRKDLLADAIIAAETSIKLSPINAGAHLCLAQALRLSKDYKRSIGEYNEYLRQSDFDSGVAGQVNYWLIGSLTGMGKRKRAGHTDVWKEMRASAYFGLCDSERRLKNYDEAIGNCQKSLRYDPTDPYANYALGLAYAVKGSNPVNKELLAAARTQFQKMLDINADLSEASIAKTNIARIEAVLK